MGVAHRVGEGVVLAMHCDPLPRAHARADPNEHATGPSDTGGKLKGAVRKTPVEIHRRNEQGNLGDEKADCDGTKDSEHWCAG